MKHKYPRTYHLPFSECLAGDDKYIQDPNMFDGKDVVVSIKMDGENTTIAKEYTHARSLDSRGHPSRDWLKAWHSTFAHDIPPNLRICGENLFAKHSIQYDDLDSYFYGFSVWEDIKCLSWDETLAWFELYNIFSVPVIYCGEYDKDKILADYEPFKEKHEGFVVRNSDSFLYDDFNKNVAKFVRKNHVQTTQHWMVEGIKPNKLKTGLTLDQYMVKY